MGITAEAGVAGELPDTRPKTSRIDWTAVRLQAAYYDTVFAYFSGRVRPREEAEDLTAETFLAAFQSLKKAQVQEPKLFLFGIARRKLADSLRKRRPAATLDDGKAPPPGTEVENRAVAASLRAAIAKLPEDQAEALLLQHLEDLSVRETAEVMNRSEISVKALLQRARQALRKDPQLRAFMEDQDE
jgi:RNA polymerase sigma-70 factor, ECF subfamily